MAIDMNDKLIAELKQKELEILRQFINACEKLGLSYYVVEGTLLGTVRHKGFIPWDDDIDVGMPRKDYEIFIEKAHEFLPEKYFIQTLDSDPEYGLNFMKIRDSETTFIESGSQKHKINHGVFIDIFPLDYIPNNKLEFEWLYFRIRLLQGRISTYFQETQKISFSRKVKIIFYKILCPSIRKSLIKKEKLMQRVRDGEKMTSYGSAWGKREVVPAEWYGEGCDLEFEGITVKAPKEYDKLLSQVYGNYMELPPVEKRIAHHYVEAVDLEKSYTNYVK